MNVIILQSHYFWISWLSSMFSFRCNDVWIKREENKVKSSTKTQNAKCKMWGFLLSTWIIRNNDVLRKDVIFAQKNVIKIILGNFWTVTFLTLNNYLIWNSYLYCFKELKVFWVKCFVLANFGFNLLLFPLKSFVEDIGYNGYSKP